MSNEEVIRSFLVQLGFRTDEKSLKKFKDGVEGATVAVGKLVASLSGAALTVGAGVAAIASNMEALYFSMQKTGASGTNLKAVEKSMVNFGVSSSEALQSVQGLARFMRDEMGAEGYLASLGVSIRTTNGEMRDTSDIMMDLAEALKSKPYALARQYAADFGIGEDALRALLNNDFSGELEKQRKALAGMDYEKVTKSAHQFMEKMRELQTYLEAFGMKVYEALTKKVGGSMESFSDWFRTNGPMIADRVSEMILLIMKLGEVIVPVLGWLLDKFIELDKATDGWSTRLIALSAIFTVLGGPAVVAGIWGLVAAMVALGKASTAAAAAGGQGWLSKIAPFLGRVAGGLGMLLYSGGLNEGEDEWAEQQRKKRNSQPGTSAGGASSQERLAGLEKQYGLPAGLLDSVWSAESGRGRNMRSSAGAQGHFQFMPGTAKQYGLNNPDDFNESSDAAARYMRDLSKHYGGNIEKAVAAYNWGPGNVDRKGLGSAPNETLRYLEKVLGGMGGGAQISQSTTINVNGGDAAATGRAVANEQGRVNQMLTRNMQTAFK